MKNSQTLLLAYTEVVNGTQSLLTEFNTELSKNGINTYNVFASIANSTEIAIRVCFTTTAPENIIFTEVCKSDVICVYVDDASFVSSTALTIFQKLANTM